MTLPFENTICRLLAIRVALVLGAALLVCSNVRAQERASVFGGLPARPNVMQKMDDFRVKLKQTFGPSGPGHNSVPESRPSQPNYGAPANGQVQRATYQQPAYNDQYGDQGYTNQGQRQFDNYPDQNYDGGQSYQADFGGVHRPQSEYETYPSGNGGGQNPGYAQPYPDAQPYPAAQPPYAGTQQGHYRSGNPLDSSISGQTQITASQRVLRLQEEYETMKQAHQSLAQENQRFRELLAEREQTIEQLDAAIATVRYELDGEQKNNQQLNHTVAELVEERTMRELETNAVLDSIRTQLDEVLLKEIVDN